MKKTYLVLLALMLVNIYHTQAQTNKVYTTSAGELIFSFATIDNAGNDNGNIVRFSPFFNFQNLVNFDPGSNIGFFTGLDLRNVGFIYDVPNSTIRKKFRSYNIGIPVGIKLGNMGGSFIYGGYEIEFPINYKEKTFVNEAKTDKFNVWFSNRQPAFYSTFMAGIQFKHGANLKFKYYLTGFFNKDYTEINNGTEIKPYENIDVNVFYISLCFNLFKNTDLDLPAVKASEIY